MYYGIGAEEGTIVTEEEAYEHALERCLKGTLDEQKEFQDMLVEWFYSGDWIRKEDNRNE